MAQTTNDHLSTPGSPREPEGGRAEAARDEAAHVKDTTVAASQQVMDTAKDKAHEVAADVREQTVRLTSKARDQVSSQAVQQRDRTTEWLRSVSDELDEMAGRTQQGGWATQLAREGSRYGRQAADFLDQREPGQLLDEVRGLARRRPGAFLIGAAVAGVVAGRLTRAMASSPGTAPGRGTPEPPGTAPGQRGAATAPGYADTNESAWPTGATAATGAPAATGATPPPGAATTESWVGEEELEVEEPTRMPPPEPTPSAPDPDPGAPVTPRFGPESRE